MAAQERAAYAHLQELQKAGAPWSDALSAMGDDYERVAAGYLTDRERTIRARSVGFPPAFDDREELIEVQAVSTSKAIVVTHDVARPQTRYERQYVVVKKHGEWRLDNVKARVLGSDGPLKQRPL
jgi:hypothetical protein